MGMGLLLDALLAPVISLSLKDRQRQRQRALGLAGKERQLGQHGLRDLGQDAIRDHSGLGFRVSMALGTLAKIAFQSAGSSLSISSSTAFCGLASSNSIAAHCCNMVCAPRVCVYVSSEQSMGVRGDVCGDMTSKLCLVSKGWG
jgi:hypothetical protein